MRSLLHRLIDITGTLAALLPLAVGVAALSGSDHRWPDILAQFTSPVLTATIIAVVIAGILRLKATITTGLVAILALAIAVWPQWFPGAPKPLHDAPTLTVYSANLWAKNTDLTAMALSIAQADADIVLLVELGDAPVAELDVLLPDYPYRLVSAPGNLTIAPARTMVASKWPLKRVPDARRQHLSAMTARVETPLGEIGVMAAHLTRPWPYQYQWGQILQTTEMAAIRPHMGAKAIIAGDFNSVSSARIGRQVKDTMGLIPAPAMVGTWPTRLPAVFGITIDQVWYSPELALIDRRLGQDNGSDHRPVITRFTLPR